MESLTKSEGIRLFQIPARIAPEELSKLCEFEGEDREKYFEFLEKKYGKGWSPEKKN